MANGFICSKRGLEVEDISNEIFNELCWRPFFEDIGREDYNDFVKLHDLVHDVAQSIMEDECHIAEFDDDTKTMNFSKRVRHLTCCFGGSSSIIVDIPNGQSLRTLMTSTNQFSDCFYHVKFRSLRALDAYYIHPSIFISHSMSNLRHLRYLNLSSSGIKILPDSVCSMHHLLTLDLSYCFGLHQLPKRLSRLKSLRHLFIQYCGNLVDLPPNIGNLTCLKTLTTFIVNKRKGCDLDELWDLNIGGYLRINNLEKVGSPMETESANLSAKSNLKELHLSWNRIENDSQDNVEHVLEALAPCPNLRSLPIYDYKGIHFPYWFSNEILGNAVSITLSNCENCSELPPLWKLTSLRDLYISGMNFVQYIDNESHVGDLNRSFVRLESLDITELSNLERFSSREGKEAFPCLRRLSLKKCPKFTLLGLGFAGLETLHVEDLPNFELAGQEGKGMFPCLSTLHAKKCPRLTLLGQDFPCLTSLHVEDLPNLELSMQDGKERFPCLSRLHVEKCPKLALPVLRAIKDLHVYEGNEMVLKSISNLQNLTQLRISDNDNTTSFPECMLQNLTSLQSLAIDRLPKLQELPTDVLIGLNALESIDISFCHELKCLPEGMFRGCTPS